MPGAGEYSSSAMRTNLEGLTGTGLETAPDHSVVPATAAAAATDRAAVAEVGTALGLAEVLSAPPPQKGPRREMVLKNTMAG